MTTNEEKPIVTKISQMDNKEWREFEFAEHQLGVVDTKANNVLMVDSVLIVISTLSLFFQTDINPIIKVLSSIATGLVLISVMFCLRTIYVKWADNENTVSDIRKIRDKKTIYLNTSIRVLFVSLMFYVALFIIDYFISL